MRFWPSVLIIGFGIVAGSTMLGSFHSQPVINEEITFQKHRQIGLAMANFRLNREQLPSNSYDATGTPLLSWRVHLLPYLGHEALYLKFKLNEPWDSPANIRLLDLMPEVYRCANDGKPASGTTVVRAFATAGSVMEAIESFQSNQRLNEVGKEPKHFSETQIIDGEANTIFAVETGDPVEWTKPENISLAIGEPLPTLGGTRGSNDFFLITLEGRALRMSKSITLLQLKALITIAGGESFDLDDSSGVVVVKNLR